MYILNYYYFTVLEFFVTEYIKRLNVEKGFFIL